MNLKLVAETTLCRRLLGATSEGLTLGTCCDHELTRSQDGKIGSKDGCNNHGEVSNQDDKRSIEILNYRLEDWDTTNKHGYGGVTMAAFRALL